jgi:putative GTP pyrophosphokinase
MKEDIKRIYDDNLSKYDRIEEEAFFIIEDFFENSNIKIHSIHSRIKEISSLIKKAENLEITQAEKVFTEIQDIVGLRIICLFISDIAEIVELLKKHFEVLNEENKITDSEISSFGYFSAHFICQLKNEYNGPRYDSIKDIIFEVQVRTISMDAWANISHYLDYKSDIEIPAELKKDFFALSGLFYVADTHFEMFFKNKKEQSKIAKEEVAKNIDSDINYETVEAYIDKNFDKRYKAEPETISELTQELLQAGYKKISDLDLKIQEAIKITPVDKRGYYNRAGIVRNMLIDVDKKYIKIWEKKYKVKVSDLKK